MYTAQLYIAGCLYKTISLSDPRDYIAIQTVGPLRFADAEMEQNVITETNKMIFRINYDVRKEQYVIRYDFDTATGTLRLSEYEVYEALPVPLSEPSENVNLNKLTAKLRDNLKARELLIRYYNS